MAHLIPPYGGDLQWLVVDQERRRQLLAECLELPSHTLTQRQLCDLELLLNGAFSPLAGFMTGEQYRRCCEAMELPGGVMWPLPIDLDVDQRLAERLQPGGRLVLRDAEGVPLALLEVEDVFSVDRHREAELCYGTDSREHPGVAYLLENCGSSCVGGRLLGLRLPRHYDFRDLRHTPQELRRLFEKRGWSRVVAFQTRNPMHRAHVELTLRAAHERGAALLIHPVVGLTKPGDLDHYTRVRCYQAILERYSRVSVALSLLPLAMRMAGPREALLHAIVRRNYGCTHFIVGRDHAGPGRDRSGRAFYSPYEAQELVRKYALQLCIELVPFRAMVYLPEEDRYCPEDQVPQGARVASLSGTELRRRLAEGREIPEWFTYPEVVDELRRSHPPRARQGFTVFFTGLSGAGKSTLANVLMVKLLELDSRRRVTLLDGDIVRRHLSSELGFSREHRDLNILRIGFVAAEITKNGGVAICAPIAPYHSVRRQVRQMVEEHGGFVLVHVSTPLEVCEQRDRKGMYAKARRGIIKNFTGISDPYEQPEDAELVVDTSQCTPEEGVRQVLIHLEREGYLA